MKSKKDEKRKGDKRGEMGEKRSIQLVVAGRLMRMSWPENSAYARSAVSIRAAKQQIGDRTYKRQCPRAPVAVDADE